MVPSLLGEQPEMAASVEVSEPLLSALTIASAFVPPPSVPPSGTAAVAQVPSEAHSPEAQSLKGKYYETTYPNATYATKLSNSSDLLGVFETSPGALLLRGVVSPAMGGTNGSNGTQLTYTPGVSILAFPLIINAMWSTDSAATGTAAGIPLALAAKTQEKYDSKVDAAGTLKTPLGTFDVLRVQVLLTRTVGTAPFTTVTTVRTFAFVTECYGTIATVTSSDNETAAEFTHAVEIRRISP
jgi:hypothetical protein